MIETRLETITPELATEYLSHNNKNRTIRRVDVDTYGFETDDTVEINISLSLENLLE